MLRKGIALVLLSIFMASITMPAIVSVIDENADMSFFMDINEEESKEKESSKDSETKIIEIHKANISLYGLALTDSTKFYLKNYARPYINLLSPPPEHHRV